MTIKEKFPIPVIDELQGSIFLTKLDFLFGYNQIRMQQEDICKTTFRTHEGHYEIFEIPFGLTNARSPFRILMNSILKPLLRKFMLISFYDIPLYNKSWEEHVQTIDIVLKILGEKTIFKCFQVFLLGIISEIFG